MTVLEFLHHLISTQRHRHPDDDDSAIRARFDSGSVVRANGSTYRPEEILNTGDHIYFYRIPAPEQPLPWDYTILYQDEHILVIDKPPFMATMPRGAHITETAVVKLRRDLGNDDISPAHRLDRLTSGLLLFTTDKRVRGAYQELFSRRKVRKHYLAIAPDRAVPSGTRWESHIHKTAGQLQAQIIASAPVNAVTHCERLHSVALSHNSEPALTGVEAGTHYALYSLRPETGRTHQLRVHMNAAGIPILGDPLYPTILPEQPEQPATCGIPLQLRSVGLAFEDPITGKTRELTCPVSAPWFFLSS